MGHRSFETTLRYAKLAPGHLHGLAAVLKGTLPPAAPTPSQSAQAYNIVLIKRTA